MKVKIHFTLLFILFSFLYSCGKLTIEGDDRTIAIPIAQGKVSLQDLIDRSESKASLKIDSDGKLTAYYEGEILRENSAKIFPPVPGIFEFPIPSPKSDVLLPVKSTYQISKGIFDNSSIFFNVTHNKKEVVNITMTIPTVSKDGKVWKQDYKLDFTNSSTGVIATPASNLDKWVAQPINNKIRFEYTATNNNGENVALQNISMRYDILRFSYLDGYFGNHVFDIKNNSIKLNIYDGWKSGGIVFDNPNILLSVDNAFGFPVRSKINSFVAKSVDGKQFNFESEFINKGIDFNYPSLSEVGKIKTTDFRFNSSNSNIGNIFENKISEIIYDFDAIANPDNNTSLKNFFNSDAFFSVNVAVELPLKIKIDNLTISDTIDVSFDNFEDAKAIELNFEVGNNFPIKLNLDAIFLDASNNVVYKVDGAKSLRIEGAELGNNSKTSSKKSTLKIINTSISEFSNLKKAKKVILSANFDSKSINNNPIWLYNDYELNIKIGAKVKLD
jgi:hypothetical protein